jgi:hypothetical protein
MLKSFAPQDCYRLSPVGEVIQMAKRMTERMTQQMTKHQMTMHRNVKQRMGKVVLKRIAQISMFSAFAFAMVGALVHGENADARSATSLIIAKSPLGSATTSGSTEKRVSEFSCSLSAFISVDSDEVIGNQAHFDGRGLVTCNNEHGFATEVPVLVEFDAEVPKSMLGRGEIAISANSSTFVVQREINQLQDTYNTRPAQSAAAVSTPEISDQPTLLLRGIRHDLVIELKLKSVTSQLSGLKVTQIQLRLDEGAPDLF